jgi:hypothetical protein
MYSKDSVRRKETLLVKGSREWNSGFVGRILLNHKAEEGQGRRRIAAAIPRSKYTEADERLRHMVPSQASASAGRQLRFPDAIDASIVVTMEPEAQHQALPGSGLSHSLVSLPFLIYVFHWQFQRVFLCFDSFLPYLSFQAVLDFPGGTELRLIKV